MHDSTRPVIGEELKVPTLHRGRHIKAEVTVTYVTFVLRLLGKG